MRINPLIVAAAVVTLAVGGSVAAVELTAGHPDRQSAVHAPTARQTAPATAPSGSPPSGVASKRCESAVADLVDKVYADNATDQHDGVGESHMLRTARKACASLNDEQFTGMASAYVWKTYGEDAGKAFDRTVGLMDDGV
jgi:hypothetical protein